MASMWALGTSVSCNFFIAKRTQDEYPDSVLHSSVFLNEVMVSPSLVRPCTHWHQPFSRTADPPEHFCLAVSCFCHCMMDSSFGPWPRGRVSGPEGVLARVNAVCSLVGPMSCTTRLPSLVSAEQTGEYGWLREWVTTFWRLRLG